MNWTDLFSALALVLILEGILPFANPGGTRRAWAMLAQSDDGKLRLGGFLSMVLGAVLLYFLRG